MATQIWCISQCVICQQKTNCEHNSLDINRVTGKKKKGGGGEMPLREGAPIRINTVFGMVLRLLLRKIQNFRIRKKASKS